MPQFLSNPPPTRYHTYITEANGAAYLPMSMNAANPDKSSFIESIMDKFLEWRNKSIDLKFTRRPPQQLSTAATWIAAGRVGWGPQIGNSIWQLLLNTLLFLCDALCFWETMAAFYALYNGRWSGSVIFRRAKWCGSNLNLEQKLIVLIFRVNDYWFYCFVEVRLWSIEMLLYAG